MLQHDSATNRVRLTLDEVEQLSVDALLASNTSRPNAESVARSIVAAEADGIHSHGLMRLPAYCEHATCGKVAGRAVPQVESTAEGAIRVDAAGGFAHPAIDAGFKNLHATVPDTGIGAVAVRNSYNCGVLGYHVEHLACRGLLALAFVNAPAAIAPWGGTKPLFGTNPVAFACPRRQGAPLVIDQSSSVVARGEVLLKAKQGEPIPDHWALDRDGKPTTDPQAVLQGGSMAPAGGYKGVTLALMVEILAAALTGARFSYEATSLTDNVGGPPGIGQFFIAINPGAFAGAGFLDRIEALCASILNEAPARLPGQRRLASREKTRREGVEISAALFDELTWRIPDSRFQR